MEEDNNQGSLFFHYLDKSGSKRKADITPLMSLGGGLAKKIAESIEARCRLYNYNGPVGPMRALMKQLGTMYYERYVCRSSSAVSEVNAIIDVLLARTKTPAIHCIDWRNPNQVSRLFYEFRAYYFKSTTYTKCLSNRNADWATLVQFVNNDLIPKKILVPFIIPKPHAGLSSRRNIDESSRTVTQPEPDSPERFLFKSLTPISLSRSDEEYLDEYYKREKCAINAIISCCRRDILRIKSEIEEGESLIAQSDYSLLCEKVAFGQKVGKPFNEQLVIDVKRDGFKFQQKKWVHLFSETHPFGISNALCWVKEKYGFYLGSASTKLPLDLRRFPRLFAPKSEVAGGVKDIPKYLGLLTMERAMPLFVLLIARTGKITPEALANADAYGDNGILRIISSVGDGDIKRITVNKDRAHKEKKALLDAELSEVVKLILKMTEPYRIYLKDISCPYWNKLWLYQKQENGVPHVILPQQFQRNFSGFSLSDKSKSFLNKHSELSPYLYTKVKNVRVSVGIIEFIESSGDITAAARILGHTVSISMDCYIPKTLQYAIYRRQIRRHQNLMLMSASAKEGYFARVTDFLSIDELHEFLAQMLDDPKRVKGNALLRILDQKINLDTEGYEKQIPIEDCIDKPCGKLIVQASSFSWAVLFLYKEHLDNSFLANIAIQSPDENTETSPWAWHELANVIHSEMKLPTYRQYLPLYEEALDLMDTHRETIIFPVLSSKGKE